MSRLDDRVNFESCNFTYINREQRHLLGVFDISIYTNEYYIFCKSREVQHHIADVCQDKERDSRDVTAHVNQE